MILIENVKILFIRVKDSMTLPILFAIWGCVPEISKECVDMTNAASTYLSIMVGAIIGSVVSWWIYYRQKKTSVKQDHILSSINELEENHGDILKKLADFDEKHESYFDAMQELKRKMDSILSKTDTDSSK